MNAPVLLSVSGLTKVFENEDGRRVTALENLDLHVRRGEFLCLLGPTGCGKTTLLRLLAGLETPTSGSISLHGTGGRNEMGFVFQQNALFPWRTVLSNVLFGLEVRGVPPAEARRKAREYLALVRLSGVERSWPYELSGGMQQRASIARALAPEPAVLLMDEPFGSLDERTRKTLQDELLALWRDRSLTVLFVTHNIEEAVALGTRVVLLGMEPGRIIRTFDVSLEHPRDRLSRPFVELLLEVRRSFAELVS